MKDPTGGGQTISQRGRENWFKCVYLCCMCVWSHTDPWAEWLRPRPLPHLLVWLNDNSRASVPAWMPSSWHAGRWICFEIKKWHNYRIRLHNQIFRCENKAISHSWYLSCTMNFFALLQLHKYWAGPKVLVFGSLWWWLISGASPAWEILKSSQLWSNKVTMDPAFFFQTFY